MRAELDSLYQELLVDPSDRALNRRMVELALELNDYDAAIGAVERLIFYDPTNADLQIEAARLYLGIKSYAAAAGYLQDVMKLPTLTEGQRIQATTLLHEANYATRPKPVAGYGQVGLRYQSNANNGSDELGPNEPLPFEKPKADWNAFALGTLGLTEPVNENVSLEATLSGYYAKQFKIERLDLGFVEVAAGPRFSTSDQKYSIRPYGIVQGILLGNDPYQFAAGGGVEATVALGDDWRLTPQFEYKNRTYYDSANYPMAENQTGALYSYSIDLDGKISDRVGWTSKVAFYDNKAETSYNSYDQYYVNAGLDVGFDAFGVENWTASPYASVSWTDFEGVAPPERYAGLDTIRQDFQWRVGLDLTMPIRDRTTLGMSIEYTQNQSNLARDDYDNLKIVIGPQGRF
ncbi:MAG TPA: surface lipoprotein assembly modifier [Bauldia sp.]|nr:surface lipoprotein assembly modifier [Bauldia sp.]